MQPMTWDTVGIRRDEDNHRRLWFEPFGELDWLDMPTPVVNWRRERCAVLISTVAGKWYRLSNYTEPDRPYVAPMADWVMTQIEPPASEA